MLGIVERTENDFIAYMQKLVQFKSFSCQEKELAEFLLKDFKELGIEESFIDGAGNFVSVIRGCGTGPNIMLNGHLDIVPVGSLENWSLFDPFKGEIVNNNLIGRGICDLKAGMAAQIFAIKAIFGAIKSGKIKLPGDLIFTGVVQEEPAEMFGMEYFFDYTMKEKNIKCDLVFLAEPSANDVALGHRGKVELVVKTYGRTAHSSSPHLGINALERMVPILDAIFAKKGINLKTDPLLGETAITVTNCIVKPGTLSVVPDECEISIDRRYTSSEKLEDLMQEFEEIFKHFETAYPEWKATVEPRTFTETSYTGYTKNVKKYHPPWFTDRQNEYVKKTFKALQNIGQQPAEKYWKFGTDGSMTCGIYKIPTIGYSGAVEKWAHQPQEQVNIDEMLKTYEGYIAILSEIYGIDLTIFN